MTRSHQLPGEPSLAKRAAQTGARFSKIGENIAVGPRAQSIHTGWMHSPGHRANILDAHFAALGVGVIDVNRQLYAVEDFSAAIANMNIGRKRKKSPRCSPLRARRQHRAGERSQVVL